MGATDVLNYIGQYHLLKCVQDYTICIEAKRRDPTLIIIARTLVTDYGMVDGPPDWGWSDPSWWWGVIKNHLPDGFDYYEVVNEVAPPPQGWEYFAHWSVEIGKLVNRDKGGKLLAFSFGPGNPDYPIWPKLIEYLKWAAETGNGVAVHMAAFMMLPVPKEGTWVNSEHIANRMVYVCDMLRTSAGFDCNTVLFFATELGLSGGYSGTWDNIWTCQQIADAYKTTSRWLAAYSPIRGFAWWNIGEVSRWHSDHACLGLMLQ